MNVRIMAALLVVVVVGAAALAAVIVESRRGDPSPVSRPVPAAAAPTSRPAEESQPAAQAEPQQASVEPVEQSTAQQAGDPPGQSAPVAEPDPEPEPVVQAAPESEPEPEPEPAAQAAAAVAQLRVSPVVIRQGETIAAVVEGGPAAEAGSATLRVGGAASEMLRVGEQWYAVQPFAPDTLIGEYAVQVDLYDEAGLLSATLAGGVQIVDSEVPLEEIYLGEGTGDPIDREALLEDIRVRFEEHTAVSGPPRWSGAWRRPVAGPDNGRFGALRSYNGQPPTGWHHGHDIAADHGDPVVAPAHGRVVWTGELVIHGIGVILDHGAGVYSGYWHLSLIAVEVGQEVAAGDWLGNIGSTGLSTGPHLHWEVIVRGQDVEPLQWLGERRPALPGEGGGLRGLEVARGDSRSGAGMTEFLGTGMAEFWVLEWWNFEGGSGGERGWEWRGGLGAGGVEIPLFGPGAGSAASAGMTERGGGYGGGGGGGRGACRWRGVSECLADGRWRVIRVLALRRRLGLGPRSSLGRRILGAE